MSVDPIGSGEPADARVVLLDSLGRPAGDTGKTAAHQPPGKLHNAFSVFVRDSDGRHLLQRRAVSKYHFAGRWANTCCGHPSPGELLSDAAHRRLTDEMGLYAELTNLGSFTYRAPDPVTGLVEYECDQLFMGLLDDDPDPDPREVDLWQWVGADELLSRIASEPSVFTPWLVIALVAFPELSGRVSG